MASTYQVVITADANAGIQEIVDYLETTISLEAADKVRKGLIETIKSLSTMPNRNTIVKEISDQQIVFRRIMKWSYRIVYTVQEDKIRVVVVDVDHGKRSPERLIKKFKK